MKKILFSTIIAAAAVTAVSAQQNDQRINKAVTDISWYKKATKSANVAKRPLTTGSPYRHQRCNQ